MHSDIKIKCTQQEMEQLFDDGGELSVRYYELVGTNLFKCTIRHADLKKSLTGTYTIRGLKNKFKHK